jgi:hypothetical protein
MTSKKILGKHPRDSDSDSDSDNIPLKQALFTTKAKPKGKQANTNATPKDTTPPKPKDITPPKGKRPRPDRIERFTMGKRVGKKKRPTERVQILKATYTEAGVRYDVTEAMQSMIGDHTLALDIILTPNLVKTVLFRNSSKRTRLTGLGTLDCITHRVLLEDDFLPLPKEKTEDTAKQVFEGKTDAKTEAEAKADPDRPWIKPLSRALCDRVRPGLYDLLVKIALSLGETRVDVMDRVEFARVRGFDPDVASVFLVSSGGSYSSDRVHTVNGSLLTHYEADFYWESEKYEMLMRQSASQK